MFNTFVDIARQKLSTLADFGYNSTQKNDPNLLCTGLPRLFLSAFLSQFWADINGSPGALEFDPEKNSTKLIFSGYLQNITKNKISKVPKFPHCAKFVYGYNSKWTCFGLK